MERLAAPEPFAGLLLDEPLVDEETWEKAGKALVAAEPTDGEIAASEPSS